MDIENVYSLEDLLKWKVKGVSFAVLGDPIEHSLSPIMHNAVIEEVAKEDSRFKEWQYFKFRIASFQLPEALRIFHAKKFMGLNLTAPHKEVALNHIISVDEVAKRMKAVNTLIFEKQGYRGINTDGYGLGAALGHHFNLSVLEKDIVLIGAGGAAKAIAVYALLEGCKSLWIGNRNLENLHNMVKGIGMLGQGRVNSFSIYEVPSNIPKQAIIINASTLGMKGSDPSPIDLSIFSKGSFVMDTIYMPFETNFLKEAKALKLPCANGLRMLMEQGARAFELWAKRAIPKEVMWNALLEQRSFSKGEGE